MQTSIEAIVFVLFLLLGILLYMTVLYKHIVQTTENPAYAKKVVWNILFRLILLLIGIVALAWYRQGHTVPQWFLYTCIAAFTVLFVWTMKNIRSHLQK